MTTTKTTRGSRDRTPAPRSADAAASRLGGSRPSTGQNPAAAKRPETPGPQRRPAGAAPASRPEPRPAPRAGLLGRLRARRIGSLRPRLLPVLIFAAVLMLGVRAGDVFVALTRGDGVEIIQPSLAQDAAETEPQAAQATRVAQAERVRQPPPPSIAGARAGDAAPPQGAGPGSDGGEVRTELFQRLAERRGELDRRSRELDQREALLTAAEQQVDRKVTELTQLRGEIERLLGTVDEQQAAQLGSLVKIYENMKPKDAARIFEELDMLVLLSVVERMREQKSAPILASMDPIKARELTARLAERRALPIRAQEAARP